MFLRDFLGNLKSDRKVNIVSKCGIMFYFSLNDFFDCTVPCVKNLLSCRVRKISEDEQGVLRVYLYGYRKG